VSRTLANFGLVLVSLAISFCGMTLGSLIAETAYTIVYGNEGDAEFFTIVFKILVGVFLFIGLPIIFYVVRTTELVLHAEFSKLMVYGSTLTLLMLATLLLAGSAFDYQWIIFFSTTAIAWWVYSEALVWLSLAPRRMLAALAIAGLVPRHSDYDSLGVTG